MIAGTWLIAFTRALTTQDTFEHIVAPSIADLQHESTARGGIPWRAYAAVWLTLVRGVGQDFRLDAATAFDRSTILRVLRVCGLVLLLMVALRLWLTLDGAGRPGDVVLLMASLPRMLAVLVPLAMLPLAASIARHRHARAILLACAVAGATVLTLETVVLPPIDRLQNELLAAATVRRGLSEADQSLSLQEVRQRHGAQIAELRALIREHEARHPDERAVMRAYRISLAAAAFAFALCGWALRLRREWAVFAVVIAVHVAWIRVVSFSLVWMSGLGFDPVFRGLLPTLAVFAFGGAAAAVRLGLERGRLMAGARSG